MEDNPICDAFSVRLLNPIKLAYTIDVSWMAGSVSSQRATLCFNRLYMLAVLVTKLTLNVA